MYFLRVCSAITIWPVNKQCIIFNIQKVTTHLLLASCESPAVTLKHSVSNCGGQEAVNNLIAISWKSRDFQVPWEFFFLFCFKSVFNQKITPSSFVNYNVWQMKICLIINSTTDNLSIDQWIQHTDLDLILIHLNFYFFQVGEILPVFLYLQSTWHHLEDEVCVDGSLCSWELRFLKQKIAYLASRDILIHSSFISLYNFLLLPPRNYDFSSSIQGQVAPSLWSISHQHDILLPEA